MSNMRAAAAGHRCKQEAAEIIRHRTATSSALVVRAAEAFHNAVQAPSGDRKTVPCRVALINYGEEYGKLVVITDVVDQNRALVDRPDEVRRMVNFKRMMLTDFKIDIPRLAKKKVLTAALEESDVFKKFESSSWGKKLAKREAKANQTDFERYQAAVARKKRSEAVKKAMKE